MNLDFFGTTQPLETAAAGEIVGLKPGSVRSQKNRLISKGVLTPDDFPEDKWGATALSALAVAAETAQAAALRERMAGHLDQLDQLPGAVKAFWEDRRAQRERQGVTKAFKAELVPIQEIGERAIADPAHEWLLPPTAVAAGYGVGLAAIGKARERHPEDFREGVEVLTEPSDTTSGVTYTKAGVIMLGFLLKGERAAEFRRYAQGLVLAVAANSQNGQPPQLAPAVPLPDPAATGAAIAERKHSDYMLSLIHI